MTGGVSFGVAIPHRSGSPLETSTIRAVAVRAESLGFNDLWPDFRSRWAHESAKSGFDLHVWRNGVVGVVPPGLLEGLIPRKDGIMPASKKYPEELRQRAQRMVAEAMSEDRSLSMTGAVKRIGPRVGVVPETLRGWIRQGDIDVGRRREQQRPTPLCGCDPCLGCLHLSRSAHKRSYSLQPELSIPVSLPCRCGCHAGFRSRIARHAHRLRDDTRRLFSPRAQRPQLVEQYRIC